MSNKWQGEKVKKKHIIDAANMWIRGERPTGFRKAIKYDVVIKGKLFPPKAICATAYKLATGITLSPSDFSGVFDGYWHRVLTKNGFKILAKNSLAMLEELTDFIRTNNLTDAELIEQAKQDSSERPQFIEVTTKSYKRSPFVRAAALRQANGKCHDCKKAPFYKTETGEAYLEVHHIIPLCKDGPDKLENVVALCPNCHAKRHDKLKIGRDDE